MKDGTARRLTALLPLSALTLLALFFHKIMTAAAAPYNWTRLQRTFILASGEQLYPPPDGPAVIAMYGPVSALVYWPATWFNSLSAVMRTAEVLNLFLFLGPAAWILWRAARERRALSAAAASFFIFSFFPFITSSLRDAAFNIHADASALFFAGLACVALSFEKKEGFSWSSSALSALFAVLAFWSKQVTLPLSFALLSYAALTAGRRAFWRYLVCLLAAGGFFSAWILHEFGFRELWFNLITIPAHQPLRGEAAEALGFAVYKLIHESFFVWIFSAAVLVLAQKKRIDGPWRVFLWVGFFMVPAAVIGRMKIGAANNTLCYAPYFFLLAAVLALAQANRDGTFRKITNGVLGLFVLTQLVLLPFKFSAVSFKPGFADVAFAYVRKYPGRAYFPRLTLVHLLSEKKVYHESAALIDRHRAGIPVSEKELRLHIPADAQLIAFHEASGDDRSWLDLPEFSAKTSDPELPGFVVYKRDSV